MPHLTDDKFAAEWGGFTRMWWSTLAGHTQLSKIGFSLEDKAMHISDLRIATRLGLGFGVLVLLIAIVGGVAQYRWRPSTVCLARWCASAFRAWAWPMKSRGCLADSGIRAQHHHDE